MSGDSLQDWLRDPAPGPGRLGLRGAADRARELAIGLLRADSDAIDGADLVELLAHLDAARASLDALASIPAGSTPAGTREAPTFLSERSPVSGRANVGAAPLEMEHLPGRTRGQATFSELHEGPSGHVHGGIVASIFDELLGVAQVHSGAAGYTVELTVKYHKVMPLFVPIVFEARVRDRQERRIHVEGSAFLASDPEVVLASAVGTFIAQAHLPIPEHLHAP